MIMIDSSHIFHVKLSNVKLDRSKCLLETHKTDILKIRIEMRVDLRMKNPKAQNKMMTKM